MVRLVHDSFPRSGSHFIEEAILHSFPEYECIWGQHIINNIREKNNVITVVRNPIDAIPSWIYFQNLKNYSIVDNINWYIRWMDATSTFQDRICIIDFNLMIKDINKCMKKYSDKFNLNYSNNCISNKQIFLSLQKKYPRHLPQKYDDDFYSLKNNILKYDEIKIALDKYNFICKLF